MKSAGLFLRLARPHFLLGGALLYALGVGLARYLGYTLDWGIYLLGQAWVTTCQLGAHFLNEYYDAPSDEGNRQRTLFNGGSGAAGPGGLPRPVALLAAAATFCVTASLSVSLIQLSSPAVWIIMGLAFLGAVLYSLPPVRLGSSGYGELSTAVMVANLTPAFAFLLQGGETLRLATLSTFPLTFLFLAMMLAFELADYAADVKHNKRTLMVRLGWQNGMLAHNLLILGAYVALGLATLVGLPASIALPALFTLPLGLLQIWAMSRIAAGARPNWFALTLAAVALFGLTAYLLAFAFWTG